ncbi:hypothetical protein [Flavobacterium sp. U410]
MTIKDDLLNRFLKKVEERFIINERKKLFGYFNNIDEQSLYILEIFEYIQSDKILKYLELKLNIKKNNLKNIFSEINYVFLIYFDFKLVKNSLVQRISIEFLKCLLFCDFSKRDKVKVNNRIIQKLFELNSWEESTSLKCKIIKNNQINLFYKNIDLIKLFEKIYYDDGIIDLLPSKFKREEVLLNFNLLLSLLNGIINYSDKNTYIKDDIEELQDALKFYFVFDYWQENQKMLEIDDYLNITPIKNIMDIDKYLKDLPKISDSSTDVEVIYKSSYIMTRFIIQYCFLNIEELPLILNLIKDNKLKKIFMIVLIHHDIYNYKEKYEIYNMKKALPTGAWELFFE